MSADNRSVVITLRLEQSKEETDVSEQVDTSSAASNNDKGSSSKAVAAWAAVQLVETVSSEVVSWVEYYWDRNLQLSDDYIGQRNKNIAITQISRIANKWSTIANSSAQGAMLGGAGGAVAGFVVGMLKSEAAIARSNIQGMDQQNILLRQLEAQLQFTRARAGWSLNAGSIGEDL
jgi:hypothetical protein